MRFYNLDEIHGVNRMTVSEKYFNALRVDLVKVEVMPTPWGNIAVVASPFLPDNIILMETGKEAYVVNLDTKTGFKLDDMRNILAMDFERIYDKDNDSWKVQVSLPWKIQNFTTGA